MFDRRKLFGGIFAGLMVRFTASKAEAEHPAYLSDEFHGPDARPVFELREFKDGNWRIKLAVYATGRFEGDIEHTGILINRIPTYGHCVASDWRHQYDPSWRKT
jgi:hypothetical protein